MRVRCGSCLTLRCLALGVASASVRTASALPPLTDSTDVKLEFLAGEASVFVSPLDARAVLVSLATTASGSGADQTGHITTDGGQHWSNNHPTTGGGDPATAIIGNPSAYGSFGRFITLGFGPKDSQVVRYKDDPNSTWTTSTVSGDLELTDKGHLWVDNSPYSPPSRRYNLYAAWSDDGFQIDVTRSVNGGVNWLAPHHDIDHEPNTLSWGVNLQTGRTGRVYAMWSKIASTGSLAARSFGFSELESDVPFDFTDETILLEDAVHNVSSSDVGVPAGVQTTPSMAVDPGSAAGDTLFAVWADKVEGGVGPQILLMKGFAGADGSPVEWDTSSLITVNQNTSTSAHQFWPWAAWDECTGSLAVVFMEAIGGTVNTRVAASQDRGQSWTEIRVSDAGWNGDVPLSGYDYIGIAAGGGRAYPVWSDNRVDPAADSLRAFVSPIQLALVLQNTLAVSFVNNPGETVTFTATWGTNRQASLGDKLYLISPSPSSQEYTSPVCSTCTADGLAHTVDFEVPCETGYWTYWVSSRRTGCLGEQRSAVKTVKVSYCLD